MDPTNKEEGGGSTLTFVDFTESIKLTPKVVFKRAYTVPLRDRRADDLERLNYSVLKHKYIFFLLIIQPNFIDSSCMA